MGLVRGRSRREEASRLPQWLVALLRLPITGKIAGANALIALAAVMVARFGGIVGQAPKLWAVLLISLAVAMVVNCALVFVALRPLKDLEDTARRVWQGELDARVPPSIVADAGVQRVGNTLNLLLDGLSADQARLRYLATQVIQAGDRERANLARELHDSTAQSLAALLLELSVLAAENNDPRLDERISRVRSIVGEVLDEVRMLAHTVHPRVLDDLGLVAALQLLVRESRQRSEVDLEFDSPSSFELDPTCASALYRIAQEAVGNAIRHAGARTVRIRLRQRHSDAELEVIDDGSGFVMDVVARRRPGMGLFTMRERAALVGGRLSVQSTPGEGTRVLAAVPCAPVSPVPLAGTVGGEVNSWNKRDSV
ncbi:MAG TPA: ATP-binding protein [Gemmatimonadaceae bacterium]